MKIKLLLVFVFLVSCRERVELHLLSPHKKFVDSVVEGNNSFYSVRSADLKQKKNLAIGVFDSGIGGLTVFNAIVNADFYNQIHKDKPDGTRDFEQEQFVYLADQANMPYSNYVEEGKKELLQEHVLKDALFLMNNKYHSSPESNETKEDKSSVKVIVIACNTATAYGKPLVEELCKVVGFEGKVIGVIDAGCKGALDVIGKNEEATIAVLATPATVTSMAYFNTLNKLKKNQKGKIEIIQQGGKGLHESIDNKPEFISNKYTKTYSEYQGPSLFNDQYKIQKDLLPYYNFDTINFRLLYNRESLNNSDTIEINSVENYTRYHIVSLVEKIKEEGHGIPLKAIILGCTHYPYVSGIINQVLKELKETETYSPVLSNSIYLVDPAVNTAKEVYKYLLEQELFNTPDKQRIETSRFFISVPNTFDPDIKTENDGRFTYEYQYRTRNINQLEDFTLIVPFSKGLLSNEQFDMIRTRLPYTFAFIENSIK